MVIGELRGGRAGFMEGLAGLKLEFVVGFVRLGEAGELSGLGELPGWGEFRGLIGLGGLVGLAGLDCIESLFLACEAALDISIEIASSNEEGRATVDSTQAIIASVTMQYPTDNKIAQPQCLVYFI